MKSFCLLLIGSLSFVSCKSKYQKGYDAGFSQGHTEGYSETYQTGYNDGQVVGYQNGHAQGTNQGHQDGYNSGYSQARTDFSSPDYENGYNLGYNTEYNLNFPIGQQDGLADGRVDGYNTGYNNGYSSGHNRGNSQGQSQGYDDGYRDYYWRGESDGRTDGYNTGYSDGRSDAYDDNYDRGYDDGYYDGYDDGYGSGFASNVNSKNPLVQLANTVNKDLIDYSKVRKFSNSQIENGSLVFAHSDSSTVDMEKLAAVKETHYLNQISRQLVAKFSLSHESAGNVAVVIHQYNKTAGSRELTEQDAQSFSKGLIGFDLHQIENAVKKSMKGDSSEFNLLIDQASKKVGTTPENFNNMIKAIFY